MPPPASPRSNLTQTRPRRSLLALVPVLGPPNQRDSRLGQASRACPESLQDPDSNWSHCWSELPLRMFPPQIRDAPMSLAPKTGRQSKAFNLIWFRSKALTPSHSAYLRLQLTNPCGIGMVPSSADIVRHNIGQDRNHQCA